MSPRLPEETRSRAEILAGLPKDDRRRILRQMGEGRCQNLQHDWGFWARPAQRWDDDGPDIQAWFAGRGFGKTRTGAERCHEVADMPEQCGGEMVLGAPTATDVRDLMVEGPSGVLRTAKPWNPVKYEPSKMRVTWEGTGVVGHLRSSEKPRSFRGLSVGFGWIDELAFWARPQECFDNILFSLREGSPSQLAITTTPLATDFIRSLMEDENVRIHNGTTFDNRANLDPKALARLKDRYDGTDIGDQELRGLVLAANRFAVFQQQWFRRIEPHECPTMFMTVVAVDPGGGDDMRTEEKLVQAGQLPPETGIVAMGIDQNGVLYCLGDASTEASDFGPNAIRLAHIVGADRIVAEVNYGGGMVQTAIQGSPDFRGSGLRFEMMRAIAGKIGRAEPVGQRAQQGRIYHVGGMHSYRDLEAQLRTLDRRVPKPKKSPDRADAYVHGALYLMQEFDARANTGMIQSPDREDLSRLAKILGRR